jgi:hypothetical protein
MPWAIAAAAVGAGISAVASSSSADKAADAQSAASNQANAEARRQFDLQRADLAPFRDLATSTLPTLKGAYGLGTPEEIAAAMERFKSSTPDYEFGFDEGKRAVEGSLAAGGMGRFGGGALKTLDRYGQNYATQRFGDWRTGLGVPAGMAQSSVNAGNQASQNYSDAYGANTRAAGDARASAYNAKGAAYGGAISDIGQIGAYGYGKGWFGGSPGTGGGSVNGTGQYLFDSGAF